GLERLVEKLARLRDHCTAVVAVAHRDQRLAAQIKIIRRRTVVAAAGQPLQLGAIDMRREHADDVASDLVLNRKDTAKPAIVAAGPKLRSAIGVDEFRANAQRLIVPAHAAG